MWIKNIILIIFLMGLFLRFFWLDISPPGFNADEAALGYNAYSLLKSGKDEWGESFPLQFRSFSDYKPGLYVYLTIPFVAILGLNELAVRLPSILLGALSIIIIYFLSKELFQKELVAQSTAILLAVSPWHLHFSRGAWEANVSTFFILFGLWSLLKGFKNRSWLALSGLGFTASVYAYQSSRLVVPILILLVVVGFWKRLVVKTNLLLALVFFILALPIILNILTGSALVRFKGLSVFADIGSLNRINQDRGQHQSQDDFSALIYHNKLVSYSQNFLKGYLDHFSPNFLFISGDEVKRNKLPGMGQLYVFEILSVILGIYFLFKCKFMQSKILWFWLLVAPIASALTFQTPSALRAHNMVIPLTLISGLGLGMIIEKVWQLQSRLKFFILCGISAICLFFVSLYLDQYYTHLPRYFALEWEYGFSQIVPFLMQNKDKYRKVIFTDKYDQPYILLLFYSRYDPLLYQTQDKRQMEGRFGFSEVVSFDKFEFRPIAKEEVGKSVDILFVGTGEEFDELSVPIKTVHFPNGKTAFKIVGR